MQRKRALITGITGQDGSYLAELLLTRGYEVHGIVRRSSSFNTARISDIYEHPQTIDRRLILHFADLTDTASIVAVLHKAQPDELYNLGGQSHVRVSFDLPAYTADVNALGTLRILDAVRASGLTSVRIYQAGSSEMFGNAAEPRQNERTPFNPRSPYAAAKAYAHWMAVNYREAYGLFVANGILFNHESPRRGATFVTRKISRGVAAIKLGRQDKLFLGNLRARRDWGFAGDYVDAMWRMLQQKTADDYVIATGETHSVQEFVEHAFAHVGLDWRQYVETDPRYLRPTEVDCLCGDARKAFDKLGWRPIVKFKGLVELMVDADLAALKQDVPIDQRHRRSRHQELHFAPEC